jgi:hypothetical protein
MKRTLRKLYTAMVAPILKTELSIANRQLRSLVQDRAAIRIERIKDNIKCVTPDNIVLDGYKIYSQTDEDGIIASIFLKIPLPPHGGSFIEIGCGDGLQNNTHALVLSGWRGAWIDSSTKNIEYIKSHVKNNKNLSVEQNFVTKESAGELVTRLIGTLGATTLDFLSLDIDGNDYYVMESILNGVRPRVVCIEYNAKFPYPMRVAMKYNKEHVWQQDDYFGASLGSFVELFRNYNYTLITCNISGINAFFVNNEEAGAFTIYPPSVLYQPPRYGLLCAPGGHSPTLKFLAQQA